MKRLWPFLLLNVVVSAATVLLVLVIWNATHSVPQPAPSGNTTAENAGGRAAPQSTLPPLNQTLFKIENVIATGDVSSEYVHFLYLGSDPLNLESWQIQSEGHTVYTFPAFVIYKNGAFDLYTRAGYDSTIDLFMGQTSSLWASGGTVKLLDPAGHVRLTYTIP